MAKTKSRLHVVAAGIVAASGAASLLSNYLRRPFKASSLLPFNASFVHASRLLSVSLGFLLLFLSLQLYRRKRMAYVFSTVTLTMLILVSFVHNFYPFKALLYVATLGFLVSIRKRFTVQNDNVSIRRGLRAALFLLAIAFIYGTVGFYLLERRDFGTEFSILQSMKYALLQLALLQNHVLPPLTRHARMFLESLDLITMLSVTLAATSLFKPVRFSLLHSHADHQAAEAILAGKPSSVEDFFKLWPHDKRYFFSKSKTAFIAYKVSNGVALILDGPSGEPRAFGSMLQHFEAFAEEQGWTTAVVHSDKKTAAIAAGNDYKSLFIGNEAFVDVPTFASSTYRSKHFRYIDNKAQREGLAYEFWRAPLTHEQIKTLRHISNEWLSKADRREYTFAMGFFDDAYLQNCDVAVLIQQGSYIAYCNIIPSFIAEQRSIDHMRHRASMPNVGMHFLLKELILQLHTEGVRTFNLGLAPLSGIDEKEDANIPEKVLRTVRAVGARFYSFKGLEQFKNKFEPEWQPYFLLYKGPATNLLKIAGALNKALSVPKPKQYVSYVAWTLAVVAGITYASFPLGYILNPSQRGLVSLLGAETAQYSWVFNVLDIVSAVIIVGLAYFAYNRYPEESTETSRSTVAYALGGLGALLAALTPLPSEVVVFTNPYSLIHVLFSFMNVTGIFAAAWFWYQHYYKHSHKHTWRQLFFFTLLITFIASTMLSAFLEHTEVGPLMQRIHIVSMSAWIAVIGIDLFRRK